MYSEKIETLIKATLVDGNITDKERNVLLKRAEAEGIDLDEFEVILDARLAELQNAKQTEPAQPKKSQKYGEVNKCPSCGAIVPALAGRCSECGFEFSGINANPITKKLSDTIEKINDKYDKQLMRYKEASDYAERWNLQKNKDLELAQVVSTTPIPVNKSDLFEFIVVAQTAAMSPATPYHMADAYMAKCEEAILKAKTLFQNDEVLDTLCAEFEIKKRQYPSIHKNQRKVSKLSPTVKIFIGLGIVYALLMLVVFIADGF